jgi:hypothetical protein
LELKKEKKEKENGCKSASLQDSGVWKSNGAASRKDQVLKS